MEAYSLPVQSSLSIRDFCTAVMAPRWYVNARDRLGFENPKYTNPNSPLPFKGSRKAHEISYSPHVQSNPPKARFATAYPAQSMVGLPPSFVNLREHDVSHCHNQVADGGWELYREGYGTGGGYGANHLKPNLDQFKPQGKPFKKFNC
eukprot:133009-Amorphochlora_amoeboformis.AAC.1